MAKKKKRRLRKPIRIALWMFSGALCASVVRLGIRAVSESAPADLGLKIARTLEMAGGVEDLTVLEESDPVLPEWSSTEQDPEDSDQEVEEPLLDEAEEDSPEIEEESDPEEQPEAAPLSLEPVAKILVDAGHGGADPGMVVSDPQNPEQDLYEKDVTLAAALEFKEAMAEINPQILVELTRTGDESTIDEEAMPYEEVIDLANRIALIDLVEPDYFLSLHCNASSDPQTSGYEMYIKPGDESSAALTEAVDEQFSLWGWSRLSAVITTDFYPLHVVTLSRVPSMLLEMGYLTNEDELRALTNVQNRTAVMTSLAQAYSDHIMSTLDPSSEEENE